MSCDEDVFEFVREFLVDPEAAKVALRHPGPLFGFGDVEARDVFREVPELAIVLQISVSGLFANLQKRYSEKIFKILLDPALSRLALEKPVEVLRDAGIRVRTDDPCELLRQDPDLAPAFALAAQVKINAVVSPVCVNKLKRSSWLQALMIDPNDQAALKKGYEATKCGQLQAIMKIVDETGEVIDMAAKRICACPH
jgi:hypothetical protein